MGDLPSKRTFLLAGLAIGAAATLGSLGIDKVRQQRPRPSQAFDDRKRLAGALWVAGQIETWDLTEAKAHGFRSVIALRPDSEEAGQPSSAEMEALAKPLGLTFAYIPVPQGPLPDDVADRLGAALAEAPGPTLLFCRSGRRAVRAWAVAEASRTEGLRPEAIAATAAQAGHPVDDLAARIAERAGRRQRS